MKYLKTFEIINHPKIGDYVQICGTHFDETLIKFFDKNIGKIIKIDSEYEFPIIIQFEKKIQMKDDSIYDDYTMGFADDEICFFSEDKERVELHKITNKYNI